MEKEKWYQFKKVDKIFGISTKIFVPAALAVIVAGRMDWIPGDLMVTAFALVMAVGGLLCWIGEITPIVRALGGKLLLPMLLGTILVKNGILTPIFTESADLFSKNGFQMFFVAAVVVGSILSTDAKFLKACIIRYVPVLVVSQIFALGFSFLAALITGRSTYEAVFFVAAPCMTGGTSGAISTLPSLYSSVLGQDVSSMAMQLYAVAMVGTYLCLIMVIVLKMLANKFPKAMDNGFGKLLRNADSVGSATMESYEKSSADYGDLMGGIFTAVVFMVLGSVLSHFVSAIVYVAWAMVIIIVLKVFNLIPDKLCRQASYFGNFAQGYLVIILVTCIGLGSGAGASLKSALQVSNLVIISLALIGACLGAAVGAKIFGLYGYETVLTAALCSCNIGASGDVQACYVSERMDLLPTFAFPFSPVDTPRGPVYEFVLHHVVEVDDPLELVRIRYTEG